MSLTPAIGFGCAICSDIFNVNEQRHICIISRCGHVYHEYCVKRWFRTQSQQGIPSSCPKCRARATQSHIIRIYLHATTAYSDDEDTIEVAHEGENSGIEHEIVRESYEDFLERYFNDVSDSEDAQEVNEAIPAPPLVEQNDNRNERAAPLDRFERGIPLDNEQAVHTGGDLYVRSLQNRHLALLQSSIPSLSMQTPMHTQPYTNSSGSDAHFQLNENSDERAAPLSSTSLDHFDSLDILDQQLITIHMSADQMSAQVRGMETFMREIESIYFNSIA